jgi:hypothetical protein
LFSIARLFKYLGGRGGKMKYRGEICKQESTGFEVIVTATNLRAKTDAEWRDYGKEINFKMLPSQAKHFPIESIVHINITPARKPRKASN